MSCDSSLLRKRVPSRPRTVASTLAWRRSISSLRARSSPSRAFARSARIIWKSGSTGGLSKKNFSFCTPGLWRTPLSEVGAEKKSCLEAEGVMAMGEKDEAAEAGGRGRLGEALARPVKAIWLVGRVLSADEVKEVESS